MNKKNLLLSIGLFCLSSVYALELPKHTSTIGKQTLNIWLWELDDSVDDRDDIENNILETLSSVNLSGIDFSAYWLDATFEHYQHFDDVIHKVDDISEQRTGFSDYIKENYSDAKFNNYHILMTEKNWDDGLVGSTIYSSHYAVASDNLETTAAHVMGHMLGAQHNFDTNWFSASIMHPYTFFLSVQNEFWSNANKEKVSRALRKLPRFPYNQVIYTDASYSGSTNNAEKYDGMGWADSKAVVYRMPISRDFSYTIEIDSADFDTYLYVYDKNGHLIAENDDGGVGMLSKLSEKSFGTLSEVFIVVTGYSNQQGNFTIKIQDNFDKVLVIKDNSTLRSLENNATELERYFYVNATVWLKIQNGAWTGNIALPENVDEGRQLTLSVNSNWPVRVSSVNNFLVVTNGETVSWIYTSGGWLMLHKTP